MKNLGSSGTTGPTKPGTASALKSSLIAAHKRRAFTSLTAEGGTFGNDGIVSAEPRSSYSHGRGQHQQHQEFEDRLGVGRPRNRTVPPPLSVRRAYSQPPATATTTTTTTATSKSKIKRRWCRTKTTRRSWRSSSPDCETRRTGDPVCLARCAFTSQRHYRNC